MNFSAENIRATIQGVLITMAIILAFIYGKYAMVMELQTLSQMMCEQGTENFDIDPEGGQINIRSRTTPNITSLFNATNYTQNLP